MSDIFENRVRQGLVGGDSSRVVVVDEVPQVDEDALSLRLTARFSRRMARRMFRLLFDYPDRWSDVSSLQRAAMMHFLDWLESPGGKAFLSSMDRDVKVEVR